MAPLIERLLSHGTVILDGAWGTQLQQLGLNDGECPDSLNLSCPDKVEEVPRAYVQAGSQVVLTNTFRANRIALQGYELSGQVEAINRAGAEVSLRAAADAASVFASIGPSGKMLMTGEVSEAELNDVFTEQAEALCSAGVHALLVETMSDLAEAKIALTAAKRTGLPVAVSMVFDSGKDLDRTMMGDTAEKLAKELTDAGADVIGANCGQGIESYIGVCSQLAAATDLPIWIKANAGLPQMENGEVVYRTSAEQFGHFAPALVDAGARFVGGCCGTSPDFIRELKRSIG
ncbi:Bifunctional homocysteine S-methyltransferase/5,10-methylenetetrahydrofolate reductase [Planctomycetes bacterium CA13]|uniref:Bifunctional homocysteine S-methyltransferase/5,10-methylenetetrahydrofolate reductase n=1 Tax=Novipirellula herctigrandis TaxID=2527986 RepID=A0A5C5YW87_9BACT|nr:Bifunctional homocysteine S-methyltransferase/5,10-methylenetetrahydrofolate reductase [Planctomycetes bacterium CA13]